MNRLSITILLLCFACGGCSSFGKNLKTFLNGGENSPAKSPENTEGLARDNMKNVPTRQYGRTTRQKIEEESQLGSRVGSLWVGEGQGSYLFSENMARVIGDLLNIKLDGAPKDQLLAKAKVIRTLLKKIDAPAKTAAAGAAGENGAKPADGAKPEGAPAEGQPKADAKPTPEKASEEVADSDDDKPMSVEVVPTRVVERMPDGNYRVEGSQAFMIGKREYRVVVAGIVRSQDFNDEGVSATRLLDPRLDIISAKKGSK